MKTFILALCIQLLLFTQVFADASVDLRLSTNVYDPDSKSLYVNLEVRNSGDGQVVLADQNYRFYYDAQFLHLDPEESWSDLPRDVYSSLHFLEILEGIKASEVGVLPFDDNLGFVNLSVDLNDDLNGGIRIAKDGDWTRVAILRFEVKSRVVPSQVVWSQEGVTDSYATAYVEMTEWTAPNYIRPLHVDKHINLAFEDKNISYPKGISIGPNPATEFIQVAFGNTFTGDLSLNIIDNVGRVVLVEKVEQGLDHLKVDVTGLESSSYILEIVDLAADTRLFTESFVLVR